MPCSAAANYQYRRRHRGQAPGIAVSARELESRDVESPTDSARANDEFLRPQPQPGGRFDRVWIDKSRNARTFIYRHAERIDLFAPRGMRAHVSNDLTDACEQAGVIEQGVACRDAVLSDLSGVAKQPGGVGQRPYGNRPIVRRHTTKFVTAY